MKHITHLLSFTVLLLLPFAAQANTNYWAGAGDGSSWSDPLNWSDGQVPGPADDVILASGAGATVVLSAGDITVQSIQCAMALSLSSGSLSVTAGASSISGACTIAAGQTLAAVGSNTVLTISGPTTADGANLFATNGATLALPALGQYAAPVWGGTTFMLQASGAGSVLRFPNLTNVLGNGADGGWLRIAALGGGRVELGQVEQMDATFQGRWGWDRQGIIVLADGTGSVVDLSLLTHFLNPAPMTGSGLSALNGGAVLIGRLAEVSGATITGTLDLGSLRVLSGCTLVLSGAAPITSQWQSLTACSVTVDGVAVELAGLTNLTQSTVVLTNGGTLNADQAATVDGASFLVSGGVVLSLPSVQACDHLDLANATFIWQASGAGSALRFPNLTNVLGNGADGGWLRIAALAGGRVELGQVEQMDATFFGRWGWYQQGITVLADGTGSVVDLSLLTRFLNPAPLSSSSLSALNGGAILASHLMELSGTAVTGAVDLGPLRVLSSCTLVLSGTAPASDQWQSLTACSVTVDGVVADLGAVTNLNQSTVVLTNGGTVNADQVATIKGANFLVSSGVVLSLPGVQTCDEPDWRNVTFTWQASGAGSVLRLPNLTNVLGNGNDAGWLRIAALAGGRVDLGQVAQMDATFTGRYGWDRQGITVLADGTGSVVDLSALRSFLDPAPLGGSSLSAVNGGVILTGDLAELSGTTVTGAVDLGTLRVLAGCTLVLSGTAPASSQWQSLTACSVTVDGVAVDLSGVTNLNQSTVVLTNGGTVNADQVATIEGANFLVSGGVVLSLPAVQTCDEPDWRNVTFTWQASGAGSVLRLPNLTNVLGNGNDAGWLRIAALAGGRVDLGRVAQMDATFTGRYGWDRQGISVLAEGTGSVVDLSALPSFLDPAPLGGSSLDATNGGTILASNLITLSGTALMLNPSGTMPTAQIQSLIGCSIFLDGISRSFPGLANADGSSFTAQDGAVLTLTNFPDLVVNHGILAFNATGAGSLIDLTVVTNLIVAPGSRLDVNVSNGGKVDLRNLESVTGGSANFLANGSGSTVDLTRLSGFLTPDGASSLTAQAEGVVVINPDTVFLLANVAITLPGLITQPSPAMVLQGRPWHSYWVEQRDMRLAGSPWVFLARVPQTEALQTFAAAPPPHTAFRLWEFVADPPLCELRRLPGTSQQLILYGAADKTYSVESATNLAPATVWAPVESVVMTNAFRLFPPAPMGDPQRFFRARQN